MIWSFVSPSIRSLISPSDSLLQVSHAVVHTDVNVCEGGRGEEVLGVTQGWMMADSSNLHGFGFGDYLIHHLFPSLGFSFFNS